MRVLLLGASGFIGSAVLARLVARGDDVVAVSRRAGAGPAGVRRVAIDIAGATSPEDWRAHLDGIDAVVNCAGTLADAPGESLRGVHVDGIDALYRACEQAGVARVVHVSAVGADDPRTPFSSTKRAGEQALTARALDWVILRPSVVVGRAAAGGSALLRGLAALPVLANMPRAGRLQIVQLDELVDTIEIFTEPGVPGRLTLDVAGPEPLTLEDAVLAFRRWLRRPEPKRFTPPQWLLGLAYRLGDFAGLLGWRAPVRSTARLELERGAVGDPARWSEMTGIRPRRLEDALAAEPASVQDQWFANLFVLKPLVFAVLAAFWILTGLVSLGPGWDIGMDYMIAGGAGALAAPGILAGAVADILIGIGIAVRRTARPALFAALVLSALYVIAGTLLLPSLWADPLGPMMKIWPIIALNIVALALLRDR